MSSLLPCLELICFQLSRFNRFYLKKLNSLLPPDAEAEHTGIPAHVGISTTSPGLRSVSAVFARGDQRAETEHILSGGAAPHLRY